MRTVLSPPDDAEDLLASAPALPDQDFVIGHRPSRTLKRGLEIQLVAQFPVEHIETLKRDLARLGDSLVITSVTNLGPQGMPTWHIHFHTKRPEEAVALCAQHGPLLRYTAFPLAPTSAPDTATSGRAGLTRPIIVICDDVDDQLSGATVLRTSEQATIEQHVLQAPAGGEAIIVAVGVPAMLIANEVAVLARNSARRRDRRAVVAVMAVPNLHSAQAALSTHNNGRLGDVMMRMHDAMRLSHY